MRIVAGAAGGRRLATPSGAGTRPTSDRAREGLFSTVAAISGPIEGARVLDLFGGTGAVALEALSRGAVEVLIVESDSRAAAVIRANVAAVGLPGARVVVARAERAVAGPSPHPYDLVFLDPPYAHPDAAVAALLGALAAWEWVAPGGLAVVERSSRAGDFPWPAGYEALRARRYGEGTLWYGRAVPSITETAGEGGQLLGALLRSGNDNREGVSDA